MKDQDVKYKNYCIIDKYDAYNYRHSKGKLGCITHFQVHSFNSMFIRLLRKG